MRKKAFTLIELLVVCGVFMVILVPTYRILSHGSKSAMQGVARNNVVMLGQQILGQIKADLALSCFVYKDGESMGINDIFTEKTLADSIEYSFFTFSGGKTEDKVLPTESGGESYRRFNKVTYTLSKAKIEPFKKLERTISYHPANPSGKVDTKKLITDRANFFEIRPVTVTSNGVSKSFFRISLQLIDQRSPGKPIATLPDGNIDPTQFFIADFVDTVNPAILNSILGNPGLNRNWYTDPSDKD
jgi:type II secretory pathway pseudopilin PulG